MSRPDIVDCIRNRPLRIAAEPFRSRSDLGAILDAWRTDGPRLARLVVAEGLAPLWYDWIAANRLGPEIPPDLLAELARQRRAAVAIYLLQRRAAIRVCDCLARAAPDPFPLLL